MMGALLLRRLLLTALGLGGSVLLPAQTPEFRALWVDAFHPGFKTAAQVQQLVADARTGHFNALIIEVRKRGDAYYHSQWEPKATDIAAGYDPLADLINQAHTGSPRLEIHAWMVTYPLWNSQTTPPSQPAHTFNRHPDWLLSNDAGQTWDGSNYQLDPGHPEVQAHLAGVAMDLIENYDIDGLHFDYIRYPGNNWGYNPAAVARFQQRYGRIGPPATSDAAWLQFRRDQVTALVRKVYLSALAVKPAVKISAATITWAPGITTDAAWSTTSAYGSVLQDWRAWMQEGILDFNLPMAYFRQSANGSDWSAWSQFIKDHRYRRHAVLGAGIYLNPLTNSLVQIRSTRTRTPAGNAADGLCGYSYAVCATDVTRAEFLAALTSPSPRDPNPVFPAAALPPDLPWKTTPTLGHLKGLVWKGSDGAALDAATVQLSGPTSKTLTADATGFYGAVDLPPGTYLAVASYTGLESASNACVVSAGRVTDCNLTLLPRAADLFLTNIRVAPGTRSAVISWDSPTPAIGWVRFGESTNLDYRTFSSRQPAIHHTVWLSNLRTNQPTWFSVVGQTADQEYRSWPRTFHSAGELILDNGLASFSAGWTAGSSAPDKYSTNYQYAGTTAGAFTASAMFIPFLETPGYYDVDVWHAQGSNRSTNAPFEIHFDSGSLTARVNQTTGGGAWQRIAQHRHYIPGTNGWVRLRNQTGESNKVVIADAVRWVFAANQDPPPDGQVPEWWSRHFFGEGGSISLDADGDGYSNAQEYVLGTDPTRSDSQLELGLLSTSNRLWQVTFFPWLPDRSYQLETLTNWEAPRWQSLPTQPAAADPYGAGSLSFTNAAMPGQFLRLRVEHRPF